MHKASRLIAACALLASTSSAQVPRSSSSTAATALSIETTEPAVSDLSTFFAAATQVLRVSVIAGDAEGYEQGVYKARVKFVFKGTSKVDELLYFGPFIGERIGVDYVLFLSPAKIASGEGMFGQVKVWQVMREGYGQQEIGYSCGFKSVKDKSCGKSVRVCTDYVHMPSGVPISSDGDPSASFGCRWFDAVRYQAALQGLKVR